MSNTDWSQYGREISVDSDYMGGSNGALEWDAAIEKDSEFILLPEGEYDFEVLTYDRGRHGGSDKLPPCNKATVHIQIKVPEGDAVIKHNLFLHQKTEGMLCNFFNAIGLRKKGEKFVMNFDATVGTKGRCKVTTRVWKNQDGQEVLANQIKNFINKEDIKPVNFKPGMF